MFPVERNSEYAMYSSGEGPDSSRNLVLLRKERYDGEEMDDLDVVLNSLTTDFRNDVCKALDNKKDIAVCISQVSGTTSDVFIFDRYNSAVHCKSASDIMREVDSCNKDQKYIDLTDIDLTDAVAAIPVNDKSMEQ